MGWLLLHRKTASKNILLTKDEMTIGRKRSCSFPIKLPFLSRIHLYMKFNGKTWIIKDLNSTNGVYIGKQRIPANEEVAITEGDTIGIGMPCHVKHYKFDTVYTLAKESKVEDIEVAREEKSEPADPSGSASREEKMDRQLETERFNDNTQPSLEAMDCSTDMVFQTKSDEKPIDPVNKDVLHQFNPVSKVQLKNKRRYVKVNKVIPKPVYEVDLTAFENRNLL